MVFGEIVPLAQAPNGGAIRDLRKDQNVAVVEERKPLVEVVSSYDMLTTPKVGREHDSSY